MYTLPLFALVRWVLKHVLMSYSLTMILVATPWPQKEWFPNLLPLLVEGPIQLPMFWSLLFQPHIHD